MLPVYILLLLLMILLAVNIYLTLRKSQVSGDYLKGIDRAEAALRADIDRSAQGSRTEIATALSRQAEAVYAQLQQLHSGIEAANRDSRRELREYLDAFKTELQGALNHYGLRQRENFMDLIANADRQAAAQTEKLAGMSTAVERAIKSLQDDNGAKLEKMREVVDEKLQKTLEARLGESFKIVSDRLEAVHRGLGDMQQLAVGVGDLKKVLTNVKTRGMLGEYQLEALLEQILTAEQYAKNVRTKPGSAAVVEFAIKLPGRNDNGEVLWLPVDSKFPKEDFELLSDAYERGDPAAIETYRKAFCKGIRKCAGDICEKYIAPPNTTDFAILFLPFESLYAEVLRAPGLFEAIQRECKIIITGPTTLSALLSSLQMGFRTLAIEQRSSEVWEVLGAVKTEFGKFGEVLARTKKKLEEAGNVIDGAATRSRAIERKLRTVQELPTTQSEVLLGLLQEEVADEETAGTV